MRSTDNPASVFIRATHVPRHRGHRSGTFERAEAVLRLQPEIGTPSIQTAVMDGDDAAVRRFLIDWYRQCRRSPESVKALLYARASIEGVDFPYGYAEVDELLSSRRRS